MREYRLRQLSNYILSKTVCKCLYSFTTIYGSNSGNLFAHLVESIFGLKGLETSKYLTTYLTSNVDQRIVFSHITIHHSLVQLFDQVILSSVIFHYHLKLKILIRYLTEL